MREYDHRKIERKWQNIWEKKGIYRAQNPALPRHGGASGASNSKKPKYYSLIEFPYPSGAGLHVGHIRSNTAMDIISRKRRMEGYNVLYPIGWDAFGLPTENYAIKTGIHPIKVTKDNTNTFRRQLKALGFSFDWSREINTTDPKYYKWTQWIFLQFFKKGLAYKKKTEINWCPSCKIGLANEEVVGGNCERCGGITEKREKEQWMLAITKYADRLDKDLDTVDYLPKIKIQQRNWIGRSEGAEIEFKIIHPTPALPKGEGEFRYHTTDSITWRALQDRVLEMRNSPTQAEDKLWQSLRKNLTGDHFRRQHIIDKFVVDFVCLAKNLVIEVDGDIHDYQQEKDKERTDILKILGFKIVRFKNEEVLRNTAGIIKKIENELKALPFGEGLGGVFNSTYPLTPSQREGELESVKVFTTRPDTLFGATYLVLAPEHGLVQKLKSQIKNWSEAETYIKKARKETEIERTAENKTKTGIELKGVKAINPATKEEIPVWIADYVLATYGTGAIMAVPAHDERDFEFAKKYGLEIKYVIAEYLSEQKYPTREDKKTVARKIAECYIRNPKNDSFLFIESKGADWRSPVCGGIEEGENFVEAGRREIYEETGYKNLKFVKYLGSPLRADFYHPQKDENRQAEFNGVFFELENEEHDEVSQDELLKQSPVWIPRNKVVSFLTISPTLFNRIEETNLCYAEEGVLVNSGQFNNLFSTQAKKEIIKFIGGKEKTTFKLRDWVFSRQRYWGEPIPLIYCDKCALREPSGQGWVPVPEKNLPVVLPKVAKYKPTDDGESPLAGIKSWVNVKCPKCKGKAKRETDTMPNWAGSSWYYLRYVDPKNNKELASKKNLKHWTPVDWYNGGMEHTTLHLLYSRFWHKFLYDLKLVPTSEPYTKRTSHGMVLAEKGEKMSKSKGNVVNPDQLIKTYGADTLRMYEMFMGPFDQTVSWSTDSLVGPRRFLERVWKIGQRKFVTVSDVELKKLLHKTIKKVSKDIEGMNFNTAVSSMMILANAMEKALHISIYDYEKFLQILAPFAPHITEGLWHNIKLTSGGRLFFQKGDKSAVRESIHLSAWPKWDEKLIQDAEVKIAVQVNGKVRTEIMIQVDDSEETVKGKALIDEIVLKHLADRDIKKIIYVKNRLINIVF